jgi:hypothetical protein
VKSRKAPRSLLPIVPKEIAPPYSPDEVLKIGFGMEYMPRGSFQANAVFFAIGALTYNLYLGFRSHARGTSSRRRRWWRWAPSSGHAAPSSRKVATVG